MATEIVFKATERYLIMGTYINPIEVEIVEISPTVDFIKVSDSTGEYWIRTTILADRVIEVLPSNTTP